jgi:hypothetical protein
MSNSLLAAAEHAHNSHSRRLTAALRREAFQAGWPASAARHLWVNHEEGEFGVHYPEHAADHIESHEYGTTGRPALPAIRQFMNRLEQHDHHLDADLYEHVRGMEVFL